MRASAPAACLPAALMLALFAISAGAGPSTKAEGSKRERAMAFLGQARSALAVQGDQAALMKNFQRALRLSDQAIDADPRLGIAHMIRGQFAVQVADWQKAAYHFEQALEVIDEEGQPLNPPGQAKGAGMGLAEIKGELHCSLGFVGIQLGKRAHQQKRFDEEQQHLAKAQRNLKAGLGFKPSALTKEMAEDLLRAFGRVPSKTGPAQ